MKDLHNPDVLQLPSLVLNIIVAVFREFLESYSWLLLTQVSLS